MEKKFTIPHNEGIDDLISIVKEETQPSMRKTRKPSTSFQKSRAPTVNWITFSLGATGTETIRVYAQVFRNKKTKEENLLQNYRSGSSFKIYSQVQVINIIKNKIK